MMFCKFNFGKRLSIIMLCVGLVTLTFGLVSYLLSEPEAHNIATLLGMFTGAGFAFTAFGIIGLLLHRFSSKEKLEQRQIEKNDERNIALIRAASTVGHHAGMACFTILAFVLVLLNQQLAAYLCIAGLYVQLITMQVAYRIYRRRM